MLKRLFQRKTEFGHSDATGLHRVLKLKDLVFFGIAAIIGGGIFSSIGDACASAGPAVIWLFVICGVACALAALCYAEFAARIPTSGSAYTYAYASFGELFAWVIGWALIMEYAIGNIYVSFAWSGYFTHILDAVGWEIPRYLITDYRSALESVEQVGSAMAAKGILIGQLADTSQWVSENMNQDQVTAWHAWHQAPVLGSIRLIADIPAFAINLIITALVYRGVKESRNSSNAMVIIKLAVVLLVIVVGAFYVDAENFKPFMPTGFGGVLAGISAVFFTYIGFDAISTLAEETENPQKNLPLGMFWALAICTVLYILISLVLTGMVPYTQLGVADPLALAFSSKGIRWMEFLVSISAVVAMTSVLLVFQMGQPRIWMSMSRDGLLPKAFSNVHPRFKTPSFSTIMTGLLVGIPIFFVNDSFVLDFTSIGTLFAFVLVCGGVLLLPSREVMPGKFHLPHWPSRWIFPFLVILTVGGMQSQWPEFFDHLRLASDSPQILKHLYCAPELHDPETSWLSHQLYWFVFLPLLTGLAIWKNASLIPLLGLAFCSYLLTGMEASNWQWFFLWFGIGLVVYFAYGYRKSHLRHV
ncbi:MAG: putative amino acid permease YhdG [Bacteroidota bacterium]|jgi:amino acid transporter